MPCTVPDQKRTWSACRLQVANHKHTIRAQIGLSIDTKAALDPNIQQANGAGIFIKKLCEPEFPSDIRSVLLNGPGMLFQDN